RPASLSPSCPPGCRPRVVSRADCTPASRTLLCSRSLEVIASPRGSDPPYLHCKDSLRCCAEGGRSSRGEAANSLDRDAIAPAQEENTLAEGVFRVLGVPPAALGLTIEREGVAGAPVQLQLEWFLQ